MHLVLDLVRGKQVVGIEPLNIIALAQCKCSVPGGRCALVRLCRCVDPLGLKLPSDSQRTISRTIIDQDDLFVRPGLRKR